MALSSPHNLHLRADVGLGRRGSLDCNRPGRGWSRAEPRRAKKPHHARPSDSTSFAQGEASCRDASGGTGGRFGPPVVSLRGERAFPA